MKRTATTDPSNASEERLREINDWQAEFWDSAKTFGALIRGATSDILKDSDPTQTREKEVYEARNKLLRHLQGMPSLRRGAELNNGRPFSCDTLAKRWQVSPDLIRELAKSGKLPHWRLGEELIRIKPETVLSVERGEISLE